MLHHSKSICAILMCLVILFSFYSVSFAESKAITFLGMPWLSDVKAVKGVVSEKLTKDLPTGEFKMASWTPPFGNNDDATIKDVPTYTLTYEGRYYYQVAGYNVKSLDIDFVPNIANETYSTTDYSTYQMIRACYGFDKDNVNDFSDIFTGLEKKLTSLYGERADTYHESLPSVGFSADGIVWKGDDDSMIILRHANSYNVYIGHMEGVYLNYYYTNSDHIMNVTNLVPVTDGVGNPDVGSTSGL